MDVEALRALILVEERRSVHAAAREAGVPRGDVDLLVHFGPAPATGPYTTTVLRRTPERRVASPAYLERAGVPRGLEDLRRHTLLTWKPPGEDGLHWPLVSGGTSPTDPVLVSADVHLVRMAAALGLGIARVPDALVAEAPDVAGPLVPVLADRVGRPCDLRALIPAAIAGTPRGRVLLEVIREIVTGLGGTEEAVG